MQSRFRTVLLSQAFFILLLYGCIRVLPRPPLNLAATSVLTCFVIAVKFQECYTDGINIYSWDLFEIHHSCVDTFMAMQYLWYKYIIACLHLLILFSPFYRSAHPFLTVWVLNFQVLKKSSFCLPLNFLFLLNRDENLYFPLWFFWSLSWQGRGGTPQYCYLEIKLQAPRYCIL